VWQIMTHLPDAQTAAPYGAKLFVCRLLGFPVSSFQLELIGERL
jgi:hypothetical protein